jgi:hypothetical protein
MKLPVFSRAESLVQIPARGSIRGLQPQDDPCPGFMHARCNIEAATCLPTLAAGPEAFAACLASVGLSDCFCCWFPC